MDGLISPAFYQRTVRRRVPFEPALVLCKGLLWHGQLVERKSMVLYLEHKNAIAGILLDRAKQRRTIYYSELGAALGIPAQGPWKPILDEISREETSAGRPDITLLISAEY